MPSKKPEQLELLRVVDLNKYRRKQRFDVWFIVNSKIYNRIFIKRDRLDLFKYMNEATVAQLTGNANCLPFRASEVQHGYKAYKTIRIEATVDLREVFRTAEVEMYSGGDWVSLDHYSRIDELVEEKFSLPK
jgi:hypothetical protein